MPSLRDALPFKSPKQRRYIYAAASRGESWAIKFIRDSGHTPPKVQGRSKGSLHRIIKGKR